MDSQNQPIVLFADLVSSALHHRCVDWATRFAFDQVASLLAEVCGSPLLSADSIWRLVQREAQHHDAVLGHAIAAVQKQGEACLPSPLFVAAAADAIYDGQAHEFVTLTDAICVPSQKPTRQKQGIEKEDKTAKRHDTDVFVVPRKDGGEQFFCEGMSENWSCVSSVLAFLRCEWSGHRLSVIAITDGARKIRADLAALFGDGVRVILDWYHLAKRVRENLSMMASSMAEREGWEAHLLCLLWAGKTTEAIDFVSSVSARRIKAKVDLLGYLQKHEMEIIDYGRRQKAGKPIGSGRMEKAVDQVIGLRQKNRGMSWTKQGSRALALLTVAQLNARRAVAA